jgi:glycosyltransferase involved in cell wall biosynthesis
VKILLVCDYFLDYLGGAQTAIAAQAAALRAAGHTVTLVAPSRHHGVGRHHFHSPVVLPGLDMAIMVNSRRTRARLSAIIEVDHIDVVHVHSEFGLAAAAIAAANAAGIPAVHTVHTFYWQSGVPSILPVAWLMRALHRFATGFHAPSVRLCANRVDDAVRSMTLATALQADAVLSPSAHQAADLRAAGVPGVTAVPNCVEPRGGATARATSLADEPLRILWIGRCIPEKRVLEFTEAAAIACEVVGTERLKVTVVGAGPLLPRMRRLAEHVQGVRVIGSVSNSAVAALLASHHASALTSFGYDNQPMTVAESIVALRGVIYVDARLREGLDEAGILIEDRSVEGMAVALVDLALDARPVITASLNASAVRHGFAAETHAASLETIYTTTIPRV